MFTARGLAGARWGAFFAGLGERAGAPRSDSALTEGGGGPRLGAGAGAESTARIALTEGASLGGSAMGGEGATATRARGALGTATDGVPSARLHAKTPTANAKESASPPPISHGQGENVGSDRSASPAPGLPAAKEFTG